MSILSAKAQLQVQEQLVADGVITAEKMQEVVEKSKADGSPLITALLHEGHVSNEVLTQAIANVTKIPYVNLLNAKVEPAILKLIPQEVAERYMAVPLGQMNQKLVVAMLDASNVQAVDFLANKVGRSLKVYAASEEGIRNVLSQYAADIASSGLESSESAPQEAGSPGNTNQTNIATPKPAAPISKVLDTIMEYAVKNKASDIHIEPAEKSLTVRCRIDGVMREVVKLSKDTEPPLVSRIKILSNLKIDEHRVPQDGQFTVTVGKKAVDLRIAISPVVWGEQVVIRLLDKSGTTLRLEDMGYTGRGLRTIRRGLERPNGMILTSGPTGSGKSTTLYALLNEIKSDKINIVTLEDPVEYKMDGVNQIQVNADVGLTFSAGLRSILRQDPDVVMVGEIRDKETATLAVQAALTGHLVFSTLHTNSAAGILPRLLDMGIEPFLIASTVRTVIGQRLVRRVSEQNETALSDQAETAAIKATIGDLLPAKSEEVAAFSKDLGFENLPLKNQSAYDLKKGIDSPAAPGGYKGRMGLYEVFEVTEEIQKLIIDQASSAEIQKVAQSQGMITMRQDGYLKALSGRTTLAEVDRVAATDSA